MTDADESAPENYVQISVKKIDTKNSENLIDIIDNAEATIRGIKEGWAL